MSKTFQEEDFATVEEYNDYLEEIEYIVFNLCNNIDLLNTNKKIEAYKKENRDIIMKNKNRLGREEYELEMELEREKLEEVHRRQELQSIEQVYWAKWKTKLWHGHGNRTLFLLQEMKKKKLKEKEALIDELMLSYDDAATIVDGYAKKVEQDREEAKIVPIIKPVIANERRSNCFHN